jgi:hypothetical protein
MTEAYDALATRARELLDVRPRPTPEEVAAQLLAEVAEEFEVPDGLRQRFTFRLAPVVIHMASSIRSSLVRPVEEAAARAYMAKPVPTREEWAERQAEPNGLAPALPASEPAAIPHAEPIDVARQVPDREAETTPRTKPREEPPPFPDWEPVGHIRYEAQVGGADAPDPGGEEGGHPGLATHATAAAFRVTPLSLRAEVLPGFRALRDEVLFVPEADGTVTYGSATAVQRQRAITYYHSVAGGYLARARRLRVIDDAIRTAGVETLNELLDRAAAPGGEA